MEFVTMELVSEVIKTSLQTEWGGWAISGLLTLYLALGFRRKAVLVSAPKKAVGPKGVKGDVYLLPKVLVLKNAKKRAYSHLLDLDFVIVSKGDKKFYTAQMPEGWTRLAQDGIVSFMDGGGKERLRHDEQGLEPLQMLS